MDMKRVEKKRFLHKTCEILFGRVEILSATAEVTNSEHIWLVRQFQMNKIYFLKPDWKLEYEEMHFCQENNISKKVETSQNVLKGFKKK